MRSIVRIVWPSPGMADRILSLRCWFDLSGVLRGGGWPRRCANRASDSIRLYAGRRSRISFRKRHVDPETNRDPGSGPRKTGGFGSDGVYAERHAFTRVKL